MSNTPFQCTLASPPMPLPFAMGRALAQCTAKRYRSYVTTHQLISLLPLHGMPI